MKMRVLLPLLMAGGIGLAGCFPTPPPPPPPPPVIDQAFTGPTNLAAAINDCCRYVAQTFTAGITGTLVGVNVEILAFGAPPLHVAIRTVGSNGVPTGTVLGEAIVASGNAPFSELIEFSQVIGVTAGVQYAIVVDYPEAPPAPGQGTAAWAGALGDPDQYPRGRGLASVHDGLVWFQSPETVGSDLHFQTHVVATHPKIH
jgi:hypothetical protein